MSQFILISCKIKFQLCVGCFPDGRMRTRTFGIKDVRPDVTADDVAAVARAIAPMLAHPVVQVRLVRVYAVVGLAAAVSSLPVYISKSHSKINNDNNETVKGTSSAMENFSEEGVKAWDTESKGWLRPRHRGRRCPRIAARNCAPR
ncbi:hypothetical protein LJC31_08745 [Synergistaceae bacterium OttesenSCG-928-I11]|nr:hypothetical protein [Synergistaceae bacterium OttesenSCG-928-I11]